MYRHLFGQSFFKRGRERGVHFVALILMVLCYSANAAAAEPDNLLAATPLFRSFGVAEGLPSTSTLKLAEDRDGFLWVGTRDGLARYDGIGFRIWRHDPADANSISGNFVAALFVDRENRLWANGEDGGLDMLDAARQHFQHYRHDGSKPDSLADNDVWAIAEGSGGTLWAGTASTGLDSLQPDGRFVHLRHNDADVTSLVSDTVLSLYADKHGRLWIGTDTGLDLRDTDASLHHIYFPEGTPSLQIRSLNAEVDDAVLVGTDHGLWRIDAALHAQQESASAALSNPSVLNSQRDAQGELWIGTKAGLNRIQQDGKLTIYRPNPAMVGSLPGNRVFDILRDHENGLWFALTDGGLAYLPPQWRNFAMFRDDASDLHNVSAGNFVGLASDPQQGVWTVNANGGIDHLDPRSGETDHVAKRLPAAGLSSLSVLADQQHRLWVGHRKGLAIFDLQDNSLKELPVDAKRDDALAPGVFDLLQTCSQGAVWLSSRGAALHRIDAGTLAITRYAANASGLQSADISALKCDANAQLWVAHAQGIQYFDKASEQFVTPPGAPKQRVQAFAFAADGTLWLHRLGALEHYGMAATGMKLIEQIDARDAWPAMDVGGLVIDAANQLWASSARGLFRIDPKSRVVRAFGIRDGLLNTEFLDHALVIAPNGILFAANLGGIVAFDPTKLTINPVSAPLLLGDISISRGAQRLSMNSVDGRLALGWDDRDLRVEARALSFANPGSNRYQFKLADYDPDWVDTGNRGERVFGQLPSGSYQLQLRAANADGVWSPTLSPLRIEVARAPWLTPWAYAGYVLCALALLLIAFLAYRARTRRRLAFALAEQKRQWAEQASAAKSGFLATMGHEIRTPMTGVLGMTELLLRTPLDERQRSYAQTIAQSGGLMLRLINDALDLARIEAGKLDLESMPFDLYALLYEVHALEQPLAARKKLGFELRIGPDAPQHVCGDALRVKQILLNLCNNALKFCDKGRVVLQLRRAPDGDVQLDIKDTGPGMSDELRQRLFQRFEQADGNITQRHGGSGLGLAICRELIECMHGTISVDSTLGVGTAFTIHLPLPEIAQDNAEEVVPTPTHGVSHSSAREVFPAAMKILLVEDDTTIARVIVSLLEAQGHTVRHAAQGLAALTELEQGDVELIFLDLDLPGIDGFQLARLQRERERENDKPRLPVIAITARSGGDEEGQAHEAGMDGFLRKPVSGAQLAEKIAEVQRNLSHVSA